MADDKNRRDEQPEDDNLDEALDSQDDATDDDDSDEPVSRGGTATRTRPKADAEDRPAKARKEGRVGVFGRIGRFVREVIAELRKVIWPTRKELLTYTAVVITFVTIMTAIVVGLDYVFAEGALWVFGNPE